MASSDDIKNALVDIKDALEDIKDEQEKVVSAFEISNKMLTLLNASYARNARANDLNWQLKANQAQINAIKSNQEIVENEDKTVEIITP